MKLIVKKNGKGYVSSYTVNVSLNLAKESGLINDDGTTKEIDLVKVDEGILIKVREDKKAKHEERKRLKTLIGRTYERLTE